MSARATGAAMRRPRGGGTGDVGIAAVMKTAKKLGIKHAFIEDESSRALEQVPESLKYLRSLK